MRLAHRLLLPALALALALTLAMPQASAATTPAQRANTALLALVRQTQTLPRAAAAPKVRLRLLTTARAARRLAARQPCRALTELGRYRRQTILLKPARGSIGARRARLVPASLRATRLLIVDRRTRGCGGGVAPSTLKEARATVMESTTERIRLRVELPELRFTTKMAGGRLWTQLSLPNTEALQSPGQPGIPIVARAFAVPDGATVTVTGNVQSSYTLDGVDVLPVQPESVDQEVPAPNFRKPPFTDRPFTIDTATYKTRAKVPAAPAFGKALGQARDLNIAGLHVPAAQYQPGTKKLTVLKTVDVTVDFGPNAGTFAGALGSPWERAQQRLLGQLINGGLVPGKLGGLVIGPCGEEMLVITNPATRTQADTFATARSAAGLLTRVKETGAGAGQIGTTNTAIRDYVRAELTRAKCIHPSYVTIMGDDDLVPTFAGVSGIPSDLEYSLKDAADLMPDVAVGRIIGNDAAEVGTAVAKIVGYETSPPGGAFLTRALIAAEFQDDNDDGQENRTFIQFAETVRNGLVARGVTVDRVYGTPAAIDPLRFNDGTDLPAALKRPAFAWNGNAADVSASWNAGDFLVVHRDHGWSDGWGTPGYGTADVEALTNGANLPVVMSINCSSGAYDYDETSFATRALVRAGGGAVGVFGDTRDSPSTANTQIALGFVDGLLPSVLPSEGPALAQRTGDALINGKVRLATIAPPPAGTTVAELYLWHYFGDPSMQMWGGGRAPITVDLSKLVIKFERKFPPPPPGDPPFKVTLTNLPPELTGQPISLLRKGEVIGKAIAGDGAVEIPALLGDGAVGPGDLVIAVEPDGGVPVQAPVDVAPVPASTLEQTCPGGGLVGDPLQVTGKLLPARAGVQVDVKFTAPGGRVVTVPATTAADGAWSAATTPLADEAGEWKAQASFAGDTGSRATSAAECSIPVTRRATTITQSCPEASTVDVPLAVQGTLAGPPPGAQVLVKFTSPRGVRVVEQTVTTDSAGAWTASAQPTPNEPGDWTVQASFAGDGTYLSAEAAACTVPVGQPPTG